MCLSIEKLKEDKGVRRARAVAAAKLSRGMAWRGVAWRVSDAMRDLHKSEPCGALVWVGFVC